MELVGQAQSISHLLDSVIEFLSNYHYVIDNQNINFFVNQHWRRISEPFQQELLGNYDKLVHLPAGKMEWSCSHESLDFLNCLNCFVKKLQSCSLFHGSSFITKCSDFNWCDILSSGLVVKRLDSVTKKDYEIDIMAGLIFGLLQHENIHRVVDVGSGLGYLDTLLVSSSEVSCDVIGLEISQHNAHKAKERHGNMLIEECRECRREWGAQCRINGKSGLPLPNRESRRCSHSIKAKGFCSVLRKVDSTLDLDGIVDEAFPPQSDKTDGYLITGLHTCGNLASDTLRLFVRCPKAIALCLVPCCHNLMSEFFNDEIVESVDKNSMPGFPLSNYLYDKKFALGYNARQWGGQGPFRVQQPPSVTLFHRALLQKLLFNHFGLIDKKWDVGRASRSMLVDFPSYVAGALRRLVPIFPSGNVPEWTADYLKKFEMEHLEQKKQLHAFLYFRMALSPCSESLIVLDKMLYLIENSCVKQFRVVKLFDPVKSARCLAFIALK